MIHSRQVVSNSGKIKDIGDDGILAYRVQLQCDECSFVWGTTVNNWQVKKQKNAFGGLDLCKFCVRDGKRNPSYGKDRSVALAYARTFQKVNGMTGKHHSPETRALQSKSKVDLIALGKFDIKSNNRGRKAYYVSKKSGVRFHADSILELARMIELDNDEKIVS
jgi:ribosomal protein L33